MTTTSVETGSPTSVRDGADVQPQADEIEILDDLDDIAGTHVMLGCGDDNPYK